MEEHNMNKRPVGNKSNIVLPLLITAAGIFWFVYGLSNYGFWDKRGSTHGFLPVIFAVIMAVFGMVALVRAAKETGATYNSEAFLIALFATLIIICTLLLGMLLSLLLFLLVWLRRIEKCSWRETLLVIVVLAVIVVGIFTLWLKVPFPKGALYSWITGLK